MAGGRLVLFKLSIVDAFQLVLGADVLLQVVGLEKGEEFPRLSPAVAHRELSTGETGRHGDGRAQTACKQTRRVSMVTSQCNISINMATV